MQPSRVGVSLPGDILLRVVKSQVAQQQLLDVAVSKELYAFARGVKLDPKLAAEVCISRSPWLLADGMAGLYSSCTLRPLIRAGRAAELFAELEAAGYALPSNRTELLNLLLGAMTMGDASGAAIIWGRLGEHLEATDSGELVTRVVLTSIVAGPATFALDVLLPAYLTSGVDREDLHFRSQYQGADAWPLAAALQAGRRQVVRRFVEQLLARGGMDACAAVRHLGGAFAWCADASVDDVAECLGLDPRPLPPPAAPAYAEENTPAAAPAYAEEMHEWSTRLFGKLTRPQYLHAMVSAAPKLPTPSNRRLLSELLDLCAPLFDDGDVHGLKRAAAEGGNADLVSAFLTGELGGLGYCLQPGWMDPLSRYTDPAAPMCGNASVVRALVEYELDYLQRCVKVDVSQLAPIDLLGLQAEEHLLSDTPDAHVGIYDCSCISVIAKADTAMKRDLMREFLRSPGLVASWIRHGQRAKSFTVAEDIAVRACEHDIEYFTVLLTSTGIVAEHMFHRRSPLLQRAFEAAIVHDAVPIVRMLVQLKGFGVSQAVLAALSEPTESDG